MIVHHTAQTLLPYHAECECEYQHCVNMGSDSLNRFVVGGCDVLSGFIVHLFPTGYLLHSRHPAGYTSLQLVTLTLHRHQNVAIQKKE